MSTKRTLAERAEQIRSLLGSPLYRYAQTVSTDAPLDDAGPDGATLADVLPADDPSPEEIATGAERRTILARRMRVLTDRERGVLALRFNGWTLEHVALATQSGSRESVRKIEARAVIKILRHDESPAEPKSPGPPASRRTS